jgi:hypothetical protein
VATTKKQAKHVEMKKTDLFNFFDGELREMICKISQEIVEIFSRAFKCLGFFADFFDILIRIIINMSFCLLRLSHLSHLLCDEGIEV